MSWIETGKNNNFLKYAYYSDGNWSSAKTIARGNDWFVNWADFPSVIAADSTEPMAAHWLKKTPGNKYAYSVNLSFKSSDGSWSTPLTPHKDNTATEHGFVSMIPWDAETILAVWLDGRQTANRPEDAYYDIQKAMTLRGALITKQGTITEKFLIDDAVCDCCQTSLIKTPNGAVIAYRNRTDEEIRDIYISRFDGRKWSSPKAIHDDNWQIGACPVNGPKLAAADSTVLIAWYTGARKSPSVKASVSNDAGKHFSDPVTLSKNMPLGRVDASLQKSKGYVSWMEGDQQRTDQANLQLAVMELGDRNLKTYTIDKLNPSRKTGFPQMERLGEDLIFAWTTNDTTQSSITTKKISLRSLSAL
jgi:hypothetical protein